MVSYAPMTNSVRTSLPSLAGKQALNHHQHHLISFRNPQPTSSWRTATNGYTTRTFSQSGITVSS